MALLAKHLLMIHLPRLFDRTSEGTGVLSWSWKALAEQPWARSFKATRPFTKGPISNLPIMHHITNTLDNGSRKWISYYAGVKPVVLQHADWLVLFKDRNCLAQSSPHRQPILHVQALNASSYNALHSTAIAHLPTSTKAANGTTIELKPKSNSCLVHINKWFFFNTLVSILPPLFQVLFIKNWEDGKSGILNLTTGHDNYAFWQQERRRIGIFCKALTIWLKIQDASNVAIPLF